MRILYFLLGLTVCPALSLAQPVTTKVAIIIDDIGYQKADPDLIRLPYPLTLAVMPFTPNGDAMLQLARQHQKELMLHMPMEAVALNHLLGKGALRRQMSKAQVQHNLRAALQDVPGVKGVNNHMGSLYTTLLPQMDWVMEVVAAQGLYFIDSKTSGRSVVAQSAQKFNIQHRSRDVFLDNDKSYAALDRQFGQLIKVAQQHGSAIAIGHPYPETYRYLKKNLPRLAAAGIELVPASHLLDLPESPHRQVQPQPDPIELPITSAAQSHPASEQPAEPAAATQPASQQNSEHTAEPAMTPPAPAVPAELPMWRVPLQADPAWYQLPAGMPVKTFNWPPFITSLPDKPATTGQSTAGNDQCCWLAQ